MERRHEPTRLEGFSDAVFGFALTLLVVSLEVPDNLDKLLSQMKGFIPFALMFAMICWIWYEHQKFFRNYGLQDAWTITVNCLLLFVVLFYVYPLKFLTTGLFHRWLPEAPDIQHSGDVVMLLYSSGVILIFGAFVLLYRHAWSKADELGLTPSERITLKYSMQSHVLSTGLGAASLTVVIIGKKYHLEMFPFYSGIMYSLMGPLHAWNGYMAGKAHERLRKAAPAPNAQR